ncbi:MAG TPA: lysozyme inhibitor LprI family protein [Caulobacteraceae bacterium]|jgi:uncharacterized protein YecT (DUF1311 family)|nr:lysozyme inhibitor LprI family protein [Caulobacteraceae bacterium]
MRILLLSAAAATLCLTAFPALAGSPEVEARYSKTFKTCPGMERSTMEMVDCIDAETKLQDKALNATYQKIMDDLNDRQKANLRTAQRAWIAYRDAWCAAQQDSDWGSISTIVANNCVLDETIRRTIELEHYPPET